MLCGGYLQGKGEEEVLGRKYVWRVGRNLGVLVSQE